MLPAVRKLFTVYACGAFTGGFLIAAFGSNNKAFGARAAQPVEARGFLG
jgi:hypothetical protein